MAKRYGLGRRPHPDTITARRLHPARPRALVGVTFRYWWQGGAWLDQGAFGTCVGNALAHRLADSPVLVEDLDQAYARKLYLDASGDATYQEGTSAILACRVLKQRGEIGEYTWVTDPQNLRTAILGYGSVCVGTVWYDSMFEPISGFLKINRSSDLVGGHEYLINGVNLKPSSGPPFYRMKNSWGRGWGNSGTAKIACEDLEELIFAENGDAVILGEVK